MNAEINANLNIWKEPDLEEFLKRDKMNKTEKLAAKKGDFYACNLKFIQML